MVDSESYPPIFDASGRYMMRTDPGRGATTLVWRVDQPELVYRIDGVSGAQGVR